MDDNENKEQFPADSSSNLVSFWRRSGSNLCKQDCQCQSRLAGFWQQFTAAANKNDRVAFRKMMAPNFADDSGGLKGTEWLRFMDENERQGSWRDFQKSLARGTIVHKAWSSKGVPTRITKDQFYYFEFRKDGKWYFAGVVGD